MKFLSAVVAFSLLAPSLSSSLPPVRPSPANKKFHDSHGRQVTFHGVNAISKGVPFVPDTSTFSADISMTTEDFEIMQELGLNVLRLGVMWPGVEPSTRGVYNETYLDEIDKIVSMAADHGVYTLLDMHQDDLSETFCGEGIPSWAVRHTDGHQLLGDFPSPVAKPFTDSFNEPKMNDAAFPTRQDCATHDWPGYYQAKAQANAWEALYTNVDGMAEQWGAMWAHVASRFKGRTEVLGIELINEPYAGDFYRDPLIMVPYPNPHNADRVKLQPAYDLVTAKIREVDPDVLVFFAPVTWSDFGAGFSAPPMGDEENSVLAFHYYEAPQFNVGVQLTAFDKAAARLNVASFLTETAAPGSSDGTFARMAAGADKHLQSWATWEWKTFCRESDKTLASASQISEHGACKTGYGQDFDKDTMRPSDANLSGHARTYPPLVAGNTTAFSYDDSTFDFSLTYNIDVSIDAPTVIYYNGDMHYPNGVNLAVEGGAECVEKETNHIECTAGQAKAGAEVTVKLTAK
jgi:endoglycosylceramidase